MEIQRPHYIIVNENNGIYHGRKKGTPQFFFAFFSDVKVYHSRAKAEQVMKNIKWNTKLRIIDCNTLN